MNSYPVYYQICRTMFMLACIVGCNLVVSPSALGGAPTENSEWTSSKPIIGSAIILAALILNFVGYTRLIQKTTISEGTTAGTLTGTPPQTAP
jgi:hypothetical protein